MSKYDHKPAFALRIVGLVTVFAILLSLSLTMNRRLLGKEIKPAADVEKVDSIMTELPDGSVQVSTPALGADVEGYAGTTPVQITIKDGRVVKVAALPNDETPSFFDEAFAALAPRWEGKSVDEAAALKVDAFSGATYSSDAVIENVSRALKYYKANYAGVDETVADNGKSPLTNAGWWCSIAVALAAAVLPFFIHNRKYRIVQLLLNVGVLGFWTGTFLSYTVFGSMLSGSLRLAMLPAWLLLAIAFLLPLFKRTNHYCTWVCPLGSAQQLAGMPLRRKLRLSHGAVTALTWMRRVLWGVLMLALWSGLWTQWVDYELFTAFILPSATTVVLCVAAAFILLSIVIDRPFCRFVCTVGTIINIPLKMD